MRCAVANGKNIGERRPAISVNINACAANCARRKQRRNSGDDTNTDNDHLRRNHFSICQTYAGDKFFALYATDFHTQAHVHAMRAMLGLFAMSPSDRSKVTVPKVEADNPFERLRKPANR